MAARTVGAVPASRHAGAGSTERQEGHMPATTTSGPDQQDSDPAMPGANEVSSLELFFDLVFVFAVSQLSHHLLGTFGWRGAAETLVLLVAVFGVWSYASWGSAMPGLPTVIQRRVLVASLFGCLWMNAALPDAFGEHPWYFVVPYLVCRVGTPLAWRASRGDLRQHYDATLVWFVLTGVIWCVGAMQPTHARLWWWLVAAVVELTGTWTAHPLPWHRLHTAEVAYDPAHMLERTRLFLLIALGEVVVSIGSAASEDLRPTGVLVAGAALVTLVALWALYFVLADATMTSRARHASDRLRATRIAVNSQPFILAGLVSLAVGVETAIAEPSASTRGLVLVLLGGPALYLATQALQLRLVGAPRSGSTTRLAGACALVVAMPAVWWLPRGVVMGLCAALVLAVVLVLRSAGRPGGRGRRRGVGAGHR